jgi:hypothetical protein
VLFRKSKTALFLTSLRKQTENPILKKTKLKPVSEKSFHQVSLSKLKFTFDGRNLLKASPRPAGILLFHMLCMQ